MIKDRGLVFKRRSTRPSRAVAGMISGSTHDIRGRRFRACHSRGTPPRAFPIASAQRIGKAQETGLEHTEVAAEDGGEIGQARRGRVLGKGRAVGGAG